MAYDFVSIAPRNIADILLEINLNNISLEHSAYFFTVSQYSISYGDLSILFLNLNHSHSQLIFDYNTNFLSGNFEVNE